VGIGELAKDTENEKGARLNGVITNLEFPDCFSAKCRQQSIKTEFELEFESEDIAQYLLTENKKIKLTYNTTATKAKAKKKGRSTQKGDLEVHPLHSLLLVFFHLVLTCAFLLQYQVQSNAFLCHIYPLIRVR
jgi:hypothetical protein